MREIFDKSGDIIQWQYWKIEMEKLEWIEELVKRSKCHLCKNHQIWFSSNNHQSYGKRGNESRAEQTKFGPNMICILECIRATATLEPLTLIVLTQFGVHGFCFLFWKWLKILEKFQFNNKMLKKYEMKLRQTNV